MKPYEQLEFTDDFMFTKVLCTNPDLCEELLELILGKKVKLLSGPDDQKAISIRYDSRGIRLDVYAEDSKENIYDIEMQVQTEKNLALRSRYYHGMLDLDQLEKGQVYDELKETYVIFLCKESIGKEYTDVIYTYRNECAEHPGLLLNDKAYTMIINASGDTSKLSLEMQEFMRFIRTGEATGTKNNFVHRLNSVVEDNRLHEKWRSEYMRFELKMQEQYRAGREEGLATGRNSTLYQLVSKGFLDKETAASESGISLDEFVSGMKAAGYEV